jgi:hypothetical protein
MGIVRVPPVSASPASGRIRTLRGANPTSWWISNDGDFPPTRGPRDPKDYRVGILPTGPPTYPKIT